MPRREFPKSVYTEIVKRATRANGNGLHVVYCEQCGVQAKVWHVDHTNPDALQVDKSRRLTADDGRVLCAGSADTCHGRKTAVDQAKIAKAKRNETRHVAGNVRQSSLAVPHADIKARTEARSKDRRGDRLPQHAQHNERRMPRGFVSAGDPR